MARTNKLRKRYKSPADLRRDHRNFTSHLAKDLQVEFESFDLGEINDHGEQLDTVTGIKVDQYHRLIVQRPKGRLTFDSNLLTAGQVKFSNHKISQQVRRNISTKLSEESNKRDKVSHSEQEGNYGGGGAYDQACEIYDAVYNILENLRTATKSSEHFNRPRMLRDHMKDVKKSTTDVWQTQVQYSAADSSLNKSQHWYNRDKLKYIIAWSELRKWLYGFINIAEIQDPIVKSIVIKHNQLLSRASKSKNNVSPIHAALSVALDFEMHAQDTFSQGLVESPNTTKDEEQSDNHRNVYTGTLPEDNHDVEGLSQAIIKDGVRDYVKETNQELAEAGMPAINADPTQDADFDKIRQTIEEMDNVKRLNVKCSGVVSKPDGTIPYQSTIDLSGIELDESSDRTRMATSSRGFKPIRNSWKLPVLGDVNVFKKHPTTSAEIITIIDGSGSMGYVRPLDERKNSSMTYPMEQATDVALAIKKRFPDSTAYIFGFPQKNERNSAKYIIAGLYEITENTFPIFPGSGTPLCGALKTLEKVHNLDHAKIIMATDGDANSCWDRDPQECVHNVIDSWRNKGVQVATLYTPYDYSTPPKSLHNDITITAKYYEPVSNQQIQDVFNFIGR